MATFERLQKLKQTINFTIPNRNTDGTGTKDFVSTQNNLPSTSIPCNNMNTSTVVLNSAPPPNTIALDSGAYSIKIGECTDKKPVNSIIPNCIMKAKAERKRVFIGNDIDDCRDLSGLYYQLPSDRGYVTRWDLQKTIWTQTVKPYLNDETTLLMTQPIINFRESQEAMDEIFFEEYYIKAMCRQYASNYLVFNHMQRHGNGGTCIVVDSGYSSTWIIPYVDGVVYKKGLMRIDIGGKLLTNHMKEILSYRQLNVMEETYVINQMKEDACYVARSFSRDMQVSKKTGPDNTIARTYVLPDFNSIRRGYIADTNSDMATLANNYQLLKLNNERFTVPELLFQPSMIGFQQMGIAEAIAHTIKRMPEYMQRTLCGNVILCGGCTKLLGYKNRLGKDLRSLTPSKYAVELFVSADPVTWAWRCAASFAKISNLYSHCVTRAQYEEYGSRFVFDKFEAPWNRDIELADSSFTEESRPSILNYNENIFAAPKTSDAEIVILSDTEEIEVEKAPQKLSLHLIQTSNSPSHTNHVQTRSSHSVLNCPPLIIAGPSASAARTGQSHKVHIEQCFSIVGGHIVDQSDTYRSTPSVVSSQAGQFYPADKFQKTITAQKQKPLYMTDGKRLFHATKTPKPSPAPRILNSSIVSSSSKKCLKLKTQRFNIVRRKPQITPTVPSSTNDAEKLPACRFVGKIPRLKSLPTRPLTTATTSTSSIANNSKCETKQPETKQPEAKQVETPSSTSAEPKASVSSQSSQPPVSSPSTPQKLVLKRRILNLKLKASKPIEETTSSSTTSPSIGLNMLSKESIYQLQQVTKVILHPLPQSTIEAATISSAAAYSACIASGAVPQATIVPTVPSSSPSTSSLTTAAPDVVATEDNEVEDVDVESEDVQNGGDNEAIANLSAATRFIRSRRGIVLKRRFQD